MERSDERRRPERDRKADRSQEDERQAKRPDPEREVEDIVVEPELLGELPAEAEALPLLEGAPETAPDALSAGTFTDPAAAAPTIDAGEASTSAERGSSLPAEDLGPNVRATPTLEATAPVVLPNVSRAAIDMVQGESVRSAPDRLGGVMPLAEPLGEPAPATEAQVGSDPAVGDAEVPAEGRQQQHTGDPHARAARELPQPVADRGAGSSESAFDPTRVTERRPQAVEAAAQARPSAERPLTSDRAADVLRQVRVHLTRGMRQATVRLEPAALGRVAIRIALREGRATTEIRAERASTLEALERHLPELRATLEQQGIDAGEFDLGLGFEQGPSFEDRPAPGDHRMHTARFASPVEERASAVLPPDPSATDDVGVDTYA